MSFVSYAQNFEDVILWRALKHIDIGFYIDVGANDPTVDSVTRAFYERGWRGINIEPLPSHYSDLLHERPRDVNLQCAVGAASGYIDIWECDVRGWATASAEVVEQHKAEGHKGIFHNVPVLTLADICSEHVSGQIHFLKIDVEGFEKSVIDGADFSKFRPWILVIEATKPNSLDEIYSEWEDVVQKAQYKFGYTDGLNRFYVAEEHKELLCSLRYPPNVFDDFVRSEQLNFQAIARQAQLEAHQAQLEAHQAQAEVRQAHSETRQAQAEARQAQAEVRIAEAEARRAESTSRDLLGQLHAIYTSTSWRLTKPIRAIRRIVGGDFSIFKRFSGLILIKTKILLRTAALQIIRYIVKSPKLRGSLIPVWQYFPSLQGWISSVIFNTGGGHVHHFHITNSDNMFMSPRAFQLYVQLKAVVDKTKLGNR